MLRSKLLALPLAAAFAVAGLGAAPQAHAFITAQDQCGAVFGQYNYWYNRWGNDWVTYNGDFDNEYVVYDYNWIIYYRNQWSNLGC
jgi:hypothetical protein